MLIMLSVISDEERNILNTLIVEVNKGDKTALSEIYKLAGGRLLSVAMGIARDKFLAEDILHDSFIKIVQYSSYYKVGTNAYAWLCTIVRNTALNKIKSENIRRTADIDSFFNISDEGSNPEKVYTAYLVENAIKSLEPRERTIIWLKYYNDMTVRAIAEELKMPKSTVQNIISMAEEKLRRLLE